MRRSPINTMDRNQAGSYAGGANVRNNGRQ
jgi:hypothetical protein